MSLIARSWCPQVLAAAMLVVALPAASQDHTPTREGILQNLGQAE